ncbi:uncharacterized protein RJT20DRAFT_60324 [Scheffersomyces xylosifermentans]|uniref:uncharacterized protein n=1 Tax=Scheffersomyces xylosifermentans TaxID=1304137 RepID=UPI00315D430A
MLSVGAFVRGSLRAQVLPSRIITRTPLRNQISRRFQSIKANGSKTIPSPPPPPPSGKKPTGIKALVKEYGYSALAVYLGLTAIDLPICYVVVHSMGKDEIEFYENKVKQTFGYGTSDEELRKKQEIDRIQEKIDAGDEPEEDTSNRSLFRSLLAQFSWTEFAIAYGIHKSLIFIRVPITAAITPSIVKQLRLWGFKIGSDKLATTATLAKDTIKDFTASSAKFGTRPNSKKKWFSWFF